MLTIDFHYRPSARSRTEEGKVFMRVIYARKTGSVTLPCTICKADWELFSSRVKDPSFIPLTKTERYLFQEREWLFSMAGELSSRGGLTVQELLSVYRFRRLKKGLASLVGELSDEPLLQRKERTAGAYRTTLRMLIFTPSVLNL